MKRINLIKKLASVSAVLALVMAGCGASGSGSSGAAESASQPEGSNTSNANVIQSDTTGSNSAADEFTIRVGVCSGDVNHYLKILDDHTGLFKNKGITFEITEFAAGINTIDAITIDQLDIGLFADYAGVNRIGNTVNDTDLRAFAVITKSASYNLYVNPEKIKSPEDLQVATLVSMAGVVFEYDYGKLFEHFELDASKANFANVGSIQEALALAASGEGDAWWSTPQTNAMFEEYGWEPFINIADVDATMYTYLVANNSYLTGHQAEVEKFLETSEEGFAYIEENLDEFADWVSADIGLNKDLVISGWQSAQYGYTFDQDAYEDLVKVEKWCYKNGNFDTDYDVADFINTDALKAIKPDSVTWSAN